MPSALTHGINLDYRNQFSTFDDVQRNREAVPEAGRTKTIHTRDDKQNRGTIPTCATRPLTTSSAIPVELPQNYMVGQQRQQISELQFDKFPHPQSFLVWKIRVAREMGSPNACRKQAAADPRGSRTCVCANTLHHRGGAADVEGEGRINVLPWYRPVGVAIPPASRKGGRTGLPARVGGRHVVRRRQSSPIPAQASCNRRQ